jgi:hypothetical protein
MQKIEPDIKVVKIAPSFNKATNQYIINNVIISDEYKAWVELGKKHQQEKRNLIDSCKHTEDELVVVFQQQQQKLLEKYRNKEEQLGKTFKDNQTHLLQLYECKLQKLLQQQEVDKTKLWDKYNV